MSTERHVKYRDGRLKRWLGKFVTSTQYGAMYLAGHASWHTFRPVPVFVLWG